MDYLLDTNICIYIAKRQPSAVASRFEKLRPGDVGMSIVTYLELVYGAWKSAPKQENVATVQELSRLIPVQPLDTASRIITDASVPNWSVQALRSAPATCSSPPTLSLLT
jgi:predicted nucleic acid-binding protein